MELSEHSGLGYLLNAVPEGTNVRADNVDGEWVLSAEGRFGPVGFRIVTRDKDLSEALNQAMNLAQNLTGSAADPDAWRSEFKRWVQTQQDDEPADPHLDR